MKTRKLGLSEKEKELVQYLMADSENTGDIQNKLKRLFAGTIEQMLEAGDYGECEISVPRDRNGEFEPKVIEKRQTRTDEIEQKIVPL